MRNLLFDVSRIPTAVDVSSQRFEDIYEAPQDEGGWLEVESVDCLSTWRIAERRQRRERLSLLQTGLCSKDGLYVPAGAVVQVRTTALDTVHTTERGLRTAAAATPLQAVRWYPGLTRHPYGMQQVVGWQYDTDAGSGADGVILPAATSTAVGSPPGYCRHLVAYMEDVAQLRVQLRTLVDLGAATTHYDGQPSARVKSVLVHPWLVVAFRNMDAGSAHRASAIWTSQPNNPVSFS